MSEDQGVDQDSEEEPFKKSSDLQYHENIGEGNKSNTTSTPEQRARARLASPKLVILYAQATPRNSNFNSNQIFIDFIINLVSFIRKLIDNLFIQFHKCIHN